MTPRRARPIRPSPAAAATLAFVLAAGCARPGPPAAPLDLAYGFTPANNAATDGGDSLPLVAGRVAGLERQGESARVHVSLERSDWEPTPEPGTYRVDVGLRGHPADDARLVTGDGRALEPRSSAAPERRGTFHTAFGTVYLHLEEGEAPPASARLSYRIARGAPREGTWYVPGRRFSGPGLSVWPGESALVEVPGPGILSLATVVEAATRRDEDAAAMRVSFRISHAGAELLAHDALVSVEGTYAWHDVDLTEALDGPARLELAVTGDFAYTSFLLPTLRDAARRRADDPRRDILVFQADTFRADNLRVYGGRYELAPDLERLAARGRLFRNAWSEGTYTLSSHATMFTGLYPHQAGIDSDERRLPDTLLTIAELLSAHGYRTGAVTDGLFVSRSRGFAKGFDWFDEQHGGGMESTARRTLDFLDADDGRPTFLFVQSYAVHTPYDVSDATRAEWGDVLDLDEDFDVVFDRYLAFPRGLHLLTEQELVEAEATVATLFDLYRGGVVDFGRAFGELHARLSDRGDLDDAYLLFLSDHGETFMEHENILHKGPVWEEQTRIPMLLLGPDVPPGVVERNVSLLDFAPTLAAIAGVRPPRDWRGRSLLSLDAERPIHLFECLEGRSGTWATIEGTRKVIAYEAPGATRDGEIVGAFDLAADPGERRDLTETTDWPDALLRRMSTEEHYFQPARPTDDATVDEAARAELEALGYGGEE